MDMSIITPSFNMLPYLKMCCASVADQEGPSFEHIVVDGVSTDGTVEWLRSQQNIISIVERDNGMYDAINKGLKSSRGEIVSYLSCDEQYLQGTLSYVRTYFERHADVDGVCGDTLITRPDGRLLSFRKSYKPVWPFIGASHLYVFPSSMFLRRKVIESGHFFDPQFKYSGDADFVIRLLRNGYRLRNTRRYLSAFTITGSNRSQEDAAQREGVLIARTMPGWVRRLRRPLNLVRLGMKLASGAYFERRPLSYSVYVPDAYEQRIAFQARRLSPMWRTWGSA
jgi:glycosyltransferase involved in cell wall biosynthesis